MVDHVHLPKFLRYIPPVIPYVANSTPSEAYDGLEFSTFPERRGFSKDDLLRGDFAGRSDSELNQFFQAWLFFGMLYEVLSAAGEEFSLDDFVEPGIGGRSYVDTLPLRDHTRRLVERELAALQGLPLGPSNAATGPLLEKVQRIDKCLEEARKFTKSLLSPSSPSALHADRLPNIIPEISLSIIILGSTLAGVRDALLPDLYKDKLFESIGSGFERIRAVQSGDLPYLPDTQPNLWGPAEYTLRKLGQGGWCPKEIEMLKQLTDLDMFFFSLLSRPTGSLGQSHSSCTPQKCVAFQVDDATYEPFHRDGCPGCGNVVFSTSHVADLVLQGQIPLVRMSNQNGRCQIELGHTDDRDYVAISHVWVQGLGNRKANTLPVCRVNHISRLVNAVSGNPADGVVSFWIDTLCVPLQPQNARRLAITQMKDVYKNARTVLVLDEELLRVSCNIPTTLGMIKYPHAADDMPETTEYDFVQAAIREVSMRVFMSPWSRRLWTLHEGALARELMIAFADGIYPLKHIVSSHRNWEMVKVPYHQLSANVIIVASSFLDLGHDGSQHGYIFSQLGLVLHHRDTSYLADEAICLGGILNLNTADLIQAGDTPETRMLELYRQLPKVPSGLLFLGGSRLTTLGFRWAPLSLLGTRLNSILAREALLTDRVVTSEHGYWGGGLFMAAEGMLLENLQAIGSASNSQAQLSKTFFVIDHWRGLIEPGRENDSEHVQEVYDDLVTFCASNAHLPSLKTENLLSTVWRVTFAGSTPWEDVLHFINDQSSGNADEGVRGNLQSDDANLDGSVAGFGLIPENVVRTRADDMVVRKAALVSNLSRRYMIVNPDGSRDFKDAVVWKSGEEDEGSDPAANLVVGGHFVANFDIEEITPEEWSIIEPTTHYTGPDDPIVFRTRGGGIVRNWVVR